MLHNDVFVRPQQLQATLEQKARVYVENQSFLDAREILREHHVCIVAGVPGIGKTMLADMFPLALRKVRLSTEESFGTVLRRFEPSRL